MTLEAAAQRLVRVAGAIEQAFRDLEWSVPNGAPEDADHPLRERYEEAVSDARYTSRELAGAAQQLARASQVIDFRDSRRALIAAQRAFHALTYQLEQGPASFDCVAELRELETAGPEPWRAWSTGVGDALDACRRPLYRGRELLFECWQDLTEGIGVFTTSILEHGAVGGVVRAPLDPTGAGADVPVDLSTK